MRNRLIWAVGLVALVVAIGAATVAISEPVEARAAVEIEDVKAELEALAVDGLETAGSNCSICVSRVVQGRLRAVGAAPRSVCAVPAAALTTVSPSPVGGSSFSGPALYCAGPHFVRSPPCRFPVVRFDPSCCWPVVPRAACFAPSPRAD